MSSRSVTCEEKLRKEFTDCVEETKKDSELKEYAKETSDTNTRCILSEMRAMRGRKTGRFW